MKLVSGEVVDLSGACGVRPRRFMRFLIGR